MLQETLFETKKQMKKSSLLISVEQYATNILKNQLSSDLVYHNFEYTERVVEAIEAIGVLEQLTDEEMEMVRIAAWFHNTGFRDVSTNHFEKSKTIASTFLVENNVPSEQIDQILNCIFAAKAESIPTSKIEKVLVDAKKRVTLEGNTKKQLDQLRQELLNVKKVEQSEVESVQNHLNSILKYQFHTVYGLSLIHI